MALAARVGREKAQEVVSSSVEEAVGKSRAFRDVLLADTRVTEHLSAPEIDAALDPRSYIGSAEELVDRALSEYESERRARL